MIPFPLPTALLCSILLLSSQKVDARVWNDTGVGTIIFEEAWTTLSLLGQIT